MTQSDPLWHSLDAGNHRETALLQPLTSNSHSKARFPIDLPFRYSAGIRNGLRGIGRVLNISSTDVRVTCRHRLKVGMPAQLVIEWPALMDGRIPIHLEMVGKVVYTDVSGFAVGSCQHRFRLVGRIAAADEAESQPQLQSQSQPQPQPANESYTFSDQVLCLPPVAELPSVHSL